MDFSALSQCGHILILTQFKSFCAYICFTADYRLLLNPHGWDIFFQYCERPFTANTFIYLDRFAGEDIDSFKHLIELNIVSWEISGKYTDFRF